MKKLALLLLLIPILSFGQTTYEDYFRSGFEKYENEDYYGAISDFTKSIELDSNFPLAYNYRGLSKSKISDHYGAISDYRKAIKVDPNDPEWTHYYYGNMGASMIAVRDNEGALNCYNKAISLNPEYASGYLNRGNAKWNLGYSVSEVCKDYREAAYLGSRRAVERINTQCN